MPEEELISLYYFLTEIQLDTRFMEWIEPQAEIFWNYYNILKQKRPKASIALEGARLRFLTSVDFLQSELFCQEPLYNPNSSLEELFYKAIHGKA